VRSAPLVQLHPPSAQELQDFLARARGSDFSYPERGATRTHAPAGYDHDHNRVRLGAGREVFERARAALERWEMFPPGWSRVTPREPASEGATVCVAFRVFGAWWLNASRIVYRFAEEAPLRRAGFAYGTLTPHVERGEECFKVEWLPDGSVWYDLRAFSRPAYWPVRLARPLARALQRRFVRDSQAAMCTAVARTAPAAVSRRAE
jgi:uncharacterized protein (UPF0548 family)